MSFPTMRQEPRRFRTIAETLNFQSCFSLYNSIFQTLEVSTNIATDRMLQNYESAISTFTDEFITQIFSNNYYANRKKYEELIALYDSDIDIFSPVSITENFTDTRTPNISSTSQTTASGNSATQNNQTRSSTSMPDTTTTTLHSVNPYDDTGLRDETQDSTTESGSRTTTETYSGNPDTLKTSSAASSTVATTGTETIVHELTRSGRDGKFSISDIIEQAEESAAKLNILDTIINDIADQIFIQVWL